MLENFENIEEVNKENLVNAKKRWMSIAKPLNSLGVLEEDVIKLGGIFGEDNIPKLKPALVVMCGDHGVVAEGVSQTGSDVTRVVAENFEKGQASASLMAKEIGADVFTIDIGIIGDNVYSNKELLSGEITDRKVACGSRNILKENAMTEKECLKAINHGIEIVGELKQKGYNIIATGEMGIGNTTASSAVASALLSLSANDTTGRGAGLSDEGLAHKIQVVEKSVERFFLEEEKPTAFHILKGLGGLEIAGITGLFLGGGIHKIPIVIDGFISAVGALVAVSINENVWDYIFASHSSREKGSSLVLKKLGLNTVIDANLCVGEGTGALMLIPILEMALTVYKNMSTFQEINIESYKEF